MEQQAPMPPHVEETVRTIQKLHTDHHASATMPERMAACVTNVISRPAFIVAVTLLITAWICGNIYLRAHGVAFFDQPPFPWLEDGLTLMALYMAALILITQRRADMLATHREQMTLQLALLSEQKAGKIIALIEEMRRDSPHLADRHDSEAEEMSTPVDARVVARVAQKIGPDDGAAPAKVLSGGAKR